MPMNWDADANQKLLLCILAVHDIKVDFAAVATTLGPDCTPRAVQEQLKKLKKQSLAQAGGATQTNSKAKAKKTSEADSPATKKRKITAPRSNIKKGKTSSQSIAGNLMKKVKDDDAEEEEEAGSKPFKSIFGNGVSQAPDEGDEDEQALNAQLVDQMGEDGGDDEEGEEI